MGATEERVKIIDDLKSAYGEKGLCNILHKIAKIRNMGIDIEKELDGEIKRLSRERGES